MSLGPAKGQGSKSLKTKRSHNGRDSPGFPTNWLLSLDKGGSLLRFRSFFEFFKSENHVYLAYIVAHYGNDDYEPLGVGHRSEEFDLAHDPRFINEVGMDSDDYDDKFSPWFLKKTERFHFFFYGQPAARVDKLFVEAARARKKANAAALRRDSG